MSALALLLCALAASATASDWAVEVSGGRAAADALAAELGLRVAGEAVPDSNVFHFKLPSTENRRSKRAAVAAADDALSSHPAVAAAERQSTPLVRVRRVPIPTPQSQSAPELCFLNTEATKEKAARRCVFPFKYKGRTYLECTADHSVNAKKWCATEVKPDGEVITGQWGDCDFSSLSCFLIGSQGGQQQAPPPRPRRPPPPPPRQRRPQSPRLPPPFLAEQGGGLQTPRFQRPPAPQFAQPPPRGNPEAQFDPRFALPPPRIPGRGRPPPPPPPGSRPGQRPPPFFFQGGGGGGGGGGVNSLVQENAVDPHPPVDPRTLKTFFTDDSWPKMWFLNRGKPGMDMNVESAWEQGYSGKGVSVTILDDGIEHTHDDLKANYDREASVDINDEDGDPFPRYDLTNSNKHGTRCAGTVAAAANNSFCAVGIAYNSGIGGVRILDGQILDILEARALSHNRQHVDIYSASWGPDDNGRTVDGPGKLARRAIEDGVKKGRGGKGSIFVWASGNGGKYLDNCNCDGYTTSIYTLSVSSSSENGLIPWYSESCSSSLATTYSSGSKRLRERKVVTTDLHGKCTDQHTGTSASSPMAAGIVALALEANPELTWRDVQHITVRAARPDGNLKAQDWASNGVGLRFSHAYGFGLMDAGEMTRLAKDWKSVPEQDKCTTSEGALTEPVVVPPGGEEAVPVGAAECKDRIKHIEHLQLHIDLQTMSPRGDLTVMLRSPARTLSVLLAPRPFDKIRTGLGSFKTWPMMSVHFWGESVAQTKEDEEDATWYLLIKNNGDRPAILHDFQLTFHGTEEDPQPGVPIKLEHKDEDVEEEPLPRNSVPSSDPGVVKLDEGVFGAERIQDGWDFEEGLVLVGVEEEVEEPIPLVEEKEVIILNDAEELLDDDDEVVVVEEDAAVVLPPVVNNEKEAEERIDVEVEDDVEDVVEEKEMVSEEKKEEE